MAATGNRDRTSAKSKKKDEARQRLADMEGIFAVPHEVKADGIVEESLKVSLIGAAAVVVIGLVSIIISSSTEDSQTLDGLEKNEIYAESNVINSGNKIYSIAEYSTKAEPSEYPYALNVKF